MSTITVFRSAQTNHAKGKNQSESDSTALKSATEWWIYDQLVQHLGGVETTLVFWRREKVVSTIRISPLESMLLGCFQHFAFLVSDNYPVRPRCVGSNMLTENPNVISINITLKNNQHSSFKRLVWSTGKSQRCTQQTNAGVLEGKRMKSSIVQIRNFRQVRTRETWNLWYEERCRVTCYMFTTMAGFLKSSKFSNGWVPDVWYVFKLSM